MTYRAECISCKCDHSPNGSRYLTHSQITSRRSNLEKRIQWDDPLGEFSILKDMKKTLKNLNQVQIKMFEQVIEHQNMPVGLRNIRKKKNTVTECEIFWINIVSRI